MRYRTRDLLPFNERRQACIRDCIDAIGSRRRAKHDVYQTSHPRDVVAGQTFRNTCICKTICPQVAFILLIVVIQNYDVNSNHNLIVFRSRGSLSDMVRVSVIAGYTKEQ